MPCRTLLALAFLFSAGLFRPASAQLANRPPTPEWLAAPGATKELRWEGTALKAILLVAGERSVTVLWDQKEIAVVEPSEIAASLDLTPQLQPGAHRIELRSPGKVAALLELNGDLARKRWLCTDATWTTANGQPVKSLGPAVATQNKPDPFDLDATFDAYNSWKLAAKASQRQATDAATFQTLPGFEVELVRSAAEDEDSWVGMTFDPSGRLILGMEKKGLLRLTLSPGGDQKIERIDDSLEECRGLLFAHGALYANANDSKALFRLRDTTGDDQFDEKTELLRTEGGVGHGRNHLTLGPDDRIWIVHGNNVLLPKDRIAPDSPLKNYADDQLLPNPWDGSMFDGNVELPAGHILSMKPDGSDLRLFAGGLRNPLDLAFNRDGELFTFDADMERDVGAPWYMPTRVLHVVPGADFGWRRGTGRWPAYYADTLPSVADIGLSSPTGICFGYGANFPARYEEALFIGDWSYGRILAVHLKPEGASYTATTETFVSGRPLNVTDMQVGPDGALWFITGGRGTQSGLYRVNWRASDSSPSGPVAEQADPKQRALRQRIEAGEANATAISSALSSDDRFLRHAARLHLERAADWPKTLRDIPSAALAAVRGQSALDRRAAMEQAVKALADGSNHDALSWLRVLEIGFARGGEVDDHNELRSHLEKLFPTKDERLNHELTKFLVFLQSDQVIAKTTSRLPSLERSEDLLFYPFILRYLDHGWDETSARIAFDALNRAEKLNGASTYFKAIADTRAELAAKLDPALAASLADVIAPPKPAQLSAHALPRHSFRPWTMKDLEPKLNRVGAGRSFDSAKKALIAAQCVFCHRVSQDNSLPAGLTGPDLSQVSARFGRRDLLQQILEPSKVLDDKFRSLVVTLSDGSVKMGAVESEDDEHLVLKPHPLAPGTVEVGVSMIVKREWSPVSPMPPGLLNGLKEDEILDLLAYFEALGDAAHPAFQAPPKTKENR
ncbi:MAG: PQQ-dependent sugar dehydrogenase [Verrucomicrobiales bacterium]|nr:PQQ-dependent sugar dehydrogenase [Verrucomicrobiales bacterium]